MWSASSSIVNNMQLVSEKVPDSNDSSPIFILLKTTRILLCPKILLELATIDKGT